MVRVVALPDLLRSEAEEVVLAVTQIMPGETEVVAEVPAVHLLELRLAPVPQAKEIQEVLLQTATLPLSRDVVEVAAVQVEQVALHQQELRETAGQVLRFLDC
jgi:hypothetical protein